MAQYLWSHLLNIHKKIIYAYRWGVKSPPPLHKIHHMHPTMMKPGTVIPYVKNIIEAPASAFSLEIIHFCYIGK